MRVVTETLNEQGQVVSTSTTDTKTILVDLDNDGVTLEIQACIEVAGKRFRAEPQTIKQGFHGELVGPNLRVKDPTDAEMTIEGQKIPCKLQQLESVVSNGQTVTKIYYSTTVAPYILKRESVTFDLEGKKELSRTTVEVTALNMPVEVLGEMKNVSQVKTVHQSASGTVTTWADVLPEVPGGVVGNSSKETDKTWPAGAPQHPETGRLQRGAGEGPRGPLRPQTLPPPQQVDFSIRALKRRWLPGIGKLLFSGRRHVGHPRHSGPTCRRPLNGPLPKATATAYAIV